MIESLFALCFGLIIGSFLNVLIYRLPRNLSIIPRSKCVHCKKIVPWYHNFPVLSFLILRGKCSSCHHKISYRYPVVEIITGLYALLLLPPVLTWPSIVSFLFYFSIGSILIAHFFIDIEHMILPDSLNLALLSLILAYAITNMNYMTWIMGGLIGALFPLIVTWAFYKLRGQIGLGGGDIKLYGIMGIFLGPTLIIQNIFLSCFLGAIFGLILISLKKMKKDKPIPFGPFIIIVFFFQLFFGDVISSFIPV